MAKKPRDKQQSYEHLIFDPTTGEEFRRYEMREVKEKSPFKRAILMNQINVVDVVTTMKPEPMRVLFLMAAYAEFDNRIPLGQKEIGEILKIDNPRVSKSIKYLKEAGYIVEVPSISRGKTYMLSPEFCWKGTTIGHRATLQQHREMSKGELRVIEGGRSKEPQSKRSA